MATTTVLATTDDGRYSAELFAAARLAYRNRQLVRVSPTNEYALIDHQKDDTFDCVATIKTYWSRTLTRGWHAMVEDNCHVGMRLDDYYLHVYAPNIRGFKTRKEAIEAALDKYAAVVAEREATR